MAVFRLEPDAGGDGAHAAGRPDLGNVLLLQNVRWFTRIRWSVVAVLAGYGLAAAAVPDWLAQAGFQAHAGWPWLLALLLALINTATILTLRRLTPQSDGSAIAHNIWLQIGADLLVLSMLVYLCGPLHTVVPFAYLFHISLACIFFARRDSFLVTLLSATLYLGLATLVIGGMVPARSLLIAGPARPADHTGLATTALPTVLIWFIVWYLVSTLSEAVRGRDARLDAANHRLLQADADKNMLVMRVAHDLKAPLAGVESNIQVLRARHAASLPDDARRLLDNIGRRGETLRKRIGDILTLGNLRREGHATARLEPVRLKPLIESVAAELRDLSAQHGITIAIEGADTEVTADPRQVGVLLANLLANAITYSREDGCVTVSVAGTPPPAAIRVSDTGIGIAPDALPHIFDDFYRSHEAVEHNPQSTGLGLAIVRQAARNLGLTIDVESTDGKGTVFTIMFPTNTGGA